MWGCGLVLAYHDLARSKYLPNRKSGIQNPASSNLSSAFSHVERRRQTQTPYFKDVAEVNWTSINAGIGSNQKLAYCRENNDYTFFLWSHSTRIVPSNPYVIQVLYCSLLPKADSAIPLAWVEPLSLTCYHISTVLHQL